MLDGLDTAVGEGDTLVILPAMAGGAAQVATTRTAFRQGAGPPGATLREVMAEPYLENKPVRRSLRRHRPGDRQHAAGRAQAALAQARRAHLGQARVAQPDGVGQGPRRARR